MKFRLHLLAFPNAQTTKEYSLCGFTQATIRFARMMKNLGHHVTLYGSEENEAPCDEFVTCITKEEISSLLGMGPWEYQYANIEDWSPLFQLFNARAAIEVAKRKQLRDMICQIGGSSQKYVTDRNKELMTVEYSIGYLGSFTSYRVFESSAWMHNTYAAQEITDGRFYDTVIPLFFDPSEFTFNEKPDDYFLYVGRLVPRKGIGMACNIATKAGIKLKIIGHGDKTLITGGHEYLGAVDMKTRNEIMSKAKAVLAPTLYVEPFGASPVEAQMCGTPTISTDFGAFHETVEQGKTGFRCSYLGEFVRACKQVEGLDRKKIRDIAHQKFSMHVLKHRYQEYFERLQILWGDGWDTID